MRTNTSGGLVWRVLVVSVSGALCGPAAAQLTSWTWNKDASDNWNVAANWQSAGPGFPDSYDAAVFFSNAVTANRTVFIPADFKVRSVSFKTALGRSYTLGGNNPGRLLFGDAPDNLIQAQAGNTGRHTINAGILLDGNNLTLENKGDFDQGGLTDLVINGIIDQATGDARSVVVTGSGRTVLTADNKYLGDTGIVGGRLSISREANLGLGSKVLVTGGTLEVTQDATIGRAIEIGGASAAFHSRNASGQGVTATYSGVISGQAPVNITGIARLSGDNTFKGDLTVDATDGGVSRLLVKADKALGDGVNKVMLKSGTFKFEAAFTCPRPLSGNGFLDTSGLDAEWSGVISGESFDKIGTGTLKVSADNSAFDGTFIASKGTLRFDTAKNIGRGDTIDLGGGEVWAAGDIRATQSLRLVIGANNQSGGSVWVSDGKTLSVSSVNGPNYALQKNGPGTLNIRGHTADPIETLTVSAGRVTLNGSINVTDGVYVNAGKFAGSGRLRGGTVWKIAAGATVDAMGKPIEGLLPTGEQVGTLYSDIGCSLDPGAIVQFDINSATGLAGAADGDLPGWDLLDLSGALGLGAGAPVTVQLSTLDAFDNHTALADFDPSRAWSWEFIRTAGVVSGFSPASFTVDSTGFLNGTTGGSFGVAAHGASLYVEFTPVPAPGLASIAAAVGVAAMGRRRR